MKVEEVGAVGSMPSQGGGGEVVVKQNNLDSGARLLISFLEVKVRK